MLYLLEKSSIRVIFDKKYSLSHMHQKKRSNSWTHFQKIKDLLFEKIFKEKFSFQKLNKVLELLFLKMFKSLNHMKKMLCESYSKIVQILLSHIREKRVFNSLSHIRGKRRWISHFLNGFNSLRYLERKMVQFFETCSKVHSISMSQCWKSRVQYCESCWKEWRIQIFESCWTEGFNSLSHV